MVSIDAFEYFGTDGHYLPCLQRFVAPGGQIGVATPALRREVIRDGRLHGLNSFLDTSQLFPRFGLPVRL